MKPALRTDGNRRQRRRMATPVMDGISPTPKSKSRFFPWKKREIQQPTAAATTMTTSTLVNHRRCHRRRCRLRRSRFRNRRHFRQHPTIRHRRPDCRLRREEMSIIFRSTPTEIQSTQIPWPIYHRVSKTTAVAVATGMAVSMAKAMAIGQLDKT